MSVTIKVTQSGAVLARSDAGPMAFEGNWYFEPDEVRRDRLQVTDRTDTCPYKGTCNWVDYVGDDGTIVRDVAWVYPEVKPGHEAIRGRYGFSARSGGATIAEEG